MEYQFEKAVEYRNLGMVKFFVGKVSDPSHWRSAIINAAEHGHLEVVKFLVENKPKGYYKHALDVAMSYAAKGGYKDLIDYFIQQGANHWLESLSQSILAGNDDLIEFFLEKALANSGEDDDWSVPLRSALKVGNLDLFKLFSEKDIDEEEWGMLLSDAIDNGKLEFVKFIIESGKYKVRAANGSCLWQKQTEIPKW